MDAMRSTYPKAKRFVVTLLLVAVIHAFIRFSLDKNGWEYKFSLEVDSAFEVSYRGLKTALLLSLCVLFGMTAITIFSDKHDTRVCFAGKSSGRDRDARARFARVSAIIAPIE